MAREPELQDHLDWLGYVQPVGLVVSAPALLAAQAYVRRDIGPIQERFRELVTDAGTITDLPRLLRDVFGWKSTDLLGSKGAGPVPDSLEAVLTDYGETLRPTYAVPDPRNADSWLMLIGEHPIGTDLDALPDSDSKHFHASPQARFERLLRATGVPTGLLGNGAELRLVYAPHLESSGYAAFKARDMAEVSGRPIFAALHMLLEADRVFVVPDGQRLHDILSRSRKYQNDVSTKLAGQVLAALYELLRGFQSADAHTKAELLRDVLAKHPDQVYAGLLTVLLRLVFLLYAEDRGLMSADEVYVNHYSITGLFEQLRTDAGHYPDTMHQRYGAWARLIALFRLVHEGGGHGDGFRLPARHGYLFDPDRFTFLEGDKETRRQGDKEIKSLPLVPDGTIWKVLENLLILDGERLSYRALDVEQIGSVYEAVMGFRLEVAEGPSIAVKAKKSGGAPVAVNLDMLLSEKSADRGKWLKERTDQEMTGAALTALRDAKSPEDVVAALGRKVSREAIPDIVPAGAMVLQPSDERRRSGSHYTPRVLTKPIVEKALAPILKQLGEHPTAEQILSLKVCDPAMGSAAFLVEACRQLGEALLKAWAVHGGMPKIPPDETPELFAQRMIAQRCLYGVDKNPMAVALAKLSLWLATLAKDHPFTFLDHALREGDSLVGLGKEQIRRFHWKESVQQMIIGQERLVERIESATHVRQEIVAAADDMPFDLKQQKLALADEALNLVRFAGNLAIAAFFAEDNDKKRQAKRDELRTQFAEYLRTMNMALRPTAAERVLRDGAKGITPFHWEIEFPEVFGRENPGFDCVVGNPPFAGKNTISEGHADGYPDWLKAIHAESHGNSDLVAHFFRRAFNLIRKNGTFGLIATNTIAQGDTRGTGLRWICTNGGTIYAARRRYKWPGLAAVVVSVVQVSNGPLHGPFDLDGKAAERITAYLFHAGGHDDPVRLKANEGKNFTGVSIYGGGFTFDDTDRDGVANPISLMHELIRKDKRNADRIFPYIGGEEVNDSPTHAHHRYVISFGDMSEAEARQWPVLMRIIEEKVKPERTTSINKDVAKWPWWQFWRIRGELTTATRGMKHVIGICRVGEKMGFALLPANTIFADSLVLLAFDTSAALCVLQSRVHEIWARFFGSSMKDDLRYTPSDCFETFPFPPNFEAHPALEAAGKEYYEFRAALMVQNNEGLTKTYNRFHDPNERSADILKMRELHAAMDRAVLAAYGGDLAKLTIPPCEFLLDYEDEEGDDGDPGASAPAARRAKKKPWRYRWPDTFRDEVLALLLELNKRRAEEEATMGAGEKGKKPKKQGKSGKGGQKGMFES